MTHTAEIIPTLTKVIPPLKNALKEKALEVVAKGLTTPSRPSQEKPPVLTTASFRPLVSGKLIDDTWGESLYTKTDSSVLHRGTSSVQVQQLWEQGGTRTRHPTGVIEPMGSKALVNTLIKNTTEGAVGMPVTSEISVASRFAETAENGKLPGFILHLNRHSFPKDTYVTLAEAICAAEGTPPKKGTLPNEHEAELTVREGLPVSTVIAFGRNYQPVQVINSDHICGKIVAESDSPKLQNSHNDYWEFFLKTMINQLSIHSTRQNSDLLEKHDELSRINLALYLAYINTLKIHPEEERAAIHTHQKEIENSFRHRGYHFSTATPQENYCYALKSQTSQINAAAGKNQRHFSTQPLTSSSTGFSANFFSPPEKISEKRKEKEALQSQRRALRTKGF